MRKVWSAVVVLLGAFVVTAAGPAQAAPSATGEFNYAEALQKAVWFYDAQRLGKLPADNRVSWRGDSFLKDGADVGLNLVGGYADAGDTIKASFPLVHAMTTLAWGMVESPQGYTTSGQSAYLLSNLRWGMDYLIAANPSPTKLVTEVGDPNTDHQLWAAAEVQTYARQTWLMDSATCWGADLGDSAAASFAAASMVFKAGDPAYAATLLTHARQLWATTESAPKNTYDTCTPVVKGFYNSWSGYGDELVWGSLWLYRATGEQSYLDRALAYYPGLPKQGQGTSSPTKYSWTLDWDDKTAASVILLAALTGNALAVADARNWADYNAGAGVGGAKVTTSPGGEAFYGTWGSLRYASGAAFIALVLADSGRLDATRGQQLHDFAVRQVNYILGDNPAHLSYMVGFGAASVQRPHQRTAHGSWDNNFYDPVEDRHTDFGGVVGGPTAADDNYGAEDRNAFQKSEVSLDYNAGMTSALARLVKEYGGTALAGFPARETPSGELFVQASLNQTPAAGATFVEIKSIMYNHTAWPARFTPNLSLRYYFTVDAGLDPTKVTVGKAYTTCSDPTGPTQFSGSVYYVTESCAGQNVGPIGQSESRRENQFRITFPGPHDWTKDWSFQGVSASQSAPTDDSHITLYDGTTLVWGTPPGPVVPPAPPTGLTASNVTATAATLRWTAPAGSVDHYDVYSGTSKVASTAGLTTAVTGLTPATDYTFTVRSVDAGGGVSAASAAVTVHTLTAPPPPSAPGTPVASAVTATTTTLTWPAAMAGGNPIVGYDVYSGLSKVASTTGALTATVTGLAPSTVYSFTVKAVDSIGQSSAASPAAAVTTAAAPPATLSARYKNNDSAPTDNQLKPGLLVANGGSGTVALSTVTLRYYFTGDAGSTAFTAQCDYAVVGCANVTTRVVALATPVTGADHYLEVGFTAGAGSAPAGGTGGELQLRVNKNDWSPFNEADDYSYATNTSFATTGTVTVYASGQLVSGTEPH